MGRIGWMGGVLVWAGLASAQDAEPTWPSVELACAETRLVAYAPDPDHGYYRGTRFDWSSLLDRLVVRGHTVLVPHHAGRHNPQGHDHVAGPAEEFDLETPPPGYAEAAPGDLFVKIGVGVLRRTDDQKYKFFASYPLVDPGVWTFAADGGTSVVYRHSVALPERGLGYELDRRLTLAPDGLALRIVRNLRNTGTEPLRTRHYAHNFVRIDGHPIGREYRVEFPFVPTAVEPVPLPSAGILEAQGIGFVPPVLARTFWARLGGFGPDSAHSRATVRHLPSGVAVSFAVDQPMADFRVYANGRILCPEAFVDLEVAPGASVTWTTVIAFELPVEGRPGTMDSHEP